MQALLMMACKLQFEPGIVLYLGSINKKYQAELAASASVTETVSVSDSLRLGQLH